MAKYRCACSDPGCKAGHKGRCKKKGTVIVIAIPGGCELHMCEECAADAVCSGTFTYK